MKTGRAAFAAAMFSFLVLVAGLTAGLVLASDPIPPSPTPPQPDEAVTQTPALDRAALVALYNATDGANWRNNTNWLTNVPVREWYGVETDGDGRVVRLHLDGNQLSGTIPSELVNLANLQTLWLSNNPLVGQIPSELGNLANLLELRLYQNQLSGEIPSELGNLANLEWLWLSDNQLSGGIPSELGNLANLLELHLYQNQLSGRYT